MEETMIDGWQGEGWYSIEWSDGGAWTNDGPVWYETREDFHLEMMVARNESTDYHIPCAEYLGDDIAPKLDAESPYYVSDTHLWQLRAAARY